MLRRSNNHQLDYAKIQQTIRMHQNMFKKRDSCIRLASRHAIDGERIVTYPGMFGQYSIAKKNYIHVEARAYVEEK